MLATLKQLIMPVMDTINKTHDSTSPAALSSECGRNLQKTKNMPQESFPMDPSRRRVVLVLNKHDIDKCRYEPGAALALANPETYVLQFPITESGCSHTAIQRIVGSGLASPGSVLVQSPFDRDYYENATLAPQRFALAKHLRFSELCMLLGAKEVSVEQIVLRKCSGKTTFDVSAERTGGKARLTVENEDFSQFRSSMHLQDEFQGGRPNIEAAESLLEQAGLGSDNNMRSLVQMRRDESNQLMKRRLVLNLSSEAQSNLNVVGRLKIPAFVQLSAEYDRVIKEQHEYALTVLVRF